ncbi:putative protein kinase [Trypanosoma grayi]|uniref:putative protein kinase n=1 Tax=Trypanosoma grayi TaxID=71804 RepID=UPI0004F45EA1|nr:putative protein kinase [Trypanosoma grayi]KEG13210.1 putative protein kinase [Trypanosoma grayi]
MRRWASDSEGESDAVREENPLLPSGGQQGCGGARGGSDDVAAAAFHGRQGGGATVLRSERGQSVSIPSPEGGQQNRSITMEFGDEYFGDVKVDRGSVIPHGRGTLQSPLGKHCYVGDFVNRSRDGYGKLVTERYVLWSKWKMNRPDLTSSARIDYANGNKYCGFLSLRQDNAAAQNLSRSQRTRLSKFSIWAQTTTPVRERWGELVGANGDRYFGQWEEDLPCGFGCLVTASGDRYVGLFEAGKFHDTGTFFSLSFGMCNASSSLLDGVGFVLAFDQTQQLVIETRDEESEKSKYHGKKRWCGVVFDGVWEKGKFIGEGHVTLPCGSRVSAEWKSASYATNGRLFVGAANARTQTGMNARGWFQCFHWEPLLCGAYEESKVQEYTSCASYRDRLNSASTQEEVQAVLSDFCSNQGSVRNALKVFRRCFYFLHGTCGKSNEIGSGLGSNKLGWCYLRNAYGGCIHRGRGRPISVADVDLAMTDIMSFVRSMERWVVEMLGDAAVADSSSETFVARRIVDYVMRDVHDVLFNLYVHAYGDEDAALSLSLERLREHTTLDDLGVDFARQQSVERLFDPYADAIYSIEQLGRRVHTFTGKLRVLAQWSKEIDLAARLAQVSLDDRSLSILPRSCTHMESGSADDLLPIHQYVLIKAKLRHLYAHTKLLVDLSGEDMLMEFTSRENFFVTTLHACASMLSNLHPLLRDESRVLAPSSLFEDRLRSAVKSLKRLTNCFLDAYVSHTGEACDITDADVLHDIAAGYLKAWLPEAIDVLSAQVTAYHSKSGLPVPIAGLLQTARARKMVRLDECQCPRSVALFCWLAVANVVSVLDLHLAIMSVNSAGAPDDMLQVDVDPTVFVAEHRRWAKSSGAVAFLVRRALRPSMLHSAAAVLLLVL